MTCLFFFQSCNLRWRIHVLPVLRVNHDSNNQNIRRKVMKKYLVIASGLIACSTLFIAASPAAAADVAVRIGVPGVYVQERPQYVRPEYENDWRARRERAYRWHEEQARERHEERREERREYNDGRRY
jgi:hypothetical protein